MRERANMMPSLGIRKKLMLALLAMLAPLAVFTGVIIYNEQRVHYEIVRFMHEHEETQFVSALQLALATALMPANDYIITGNMAYLKDFNENSAEIERLIAKVRRSLLTKDHFTETASELGIKKELIAGWDHVKASSLKIFSIKNPVNNKTAINLMKEMDYKYGYPLIKRLEEWQTLEQVHMREAEASLATLTHRAYAGTILSSLAVALVGVIFALVYSGRFTNAIKKLDAETMAIAMGDFKRKITLDTNDELESLASAINRMSSELEASYSQLEGKIAERTKELAESEEDLKQKIEELERFRKATLKREVRMKELREKLKELENRANAAAG